MSRPTPNRPPPQASASPHKRRKPARDTREPPPAPRTADIFETRQRRLLARITTSKRPVVWVSAIAGSGKTRLLQALASADAAAGRVILDEPSAKSLRRALTARTFADATGAALVVASRPSDAIAGVLLQTRLYGHVDVIGDAEMFLTEDDCAASPLPGLHAATGGWPMLADAALGGRATEAQALLPDFLPAHVLPGLADGVRAALLYALVPGAASAPVKAEAAAVDAHPLLASGEGRARIAGAWIEQALRQACAIRMPVPPAVSSRLVAWLDADGEPARAIVGLLRLGLVADALALFEKSGGPYFGFRNGFAALEAVLTEFGAQAEARSESLLLARLYLLFKSGKTAEALRRLDAHYPRLPVDLRRLQASHRARAILLRIDMAVDLDEALPVEVVTSWGRLLPFLPEDEPMARGILFNTMTLAFLRADRLVQGQQLALEALAAYERARSPYLVHFMLVHLADIALRQGQLQAVGENLGRAERALRSSGLRMNSEQATLDAFHARLAYEEGRIEDCPAGVEDILAALVEGDCWPGLFRTIIGYAPFVAFWRDGLKAALNTADQCILALGRRHGPTDDYGLVLTRIRLMQMARRHTPASARLRELALETRRHRSPHLGTEERLVRLRARILQHLPGDADVQEAVAIAESTDMQPRQRITLDLLHAFLLHRRAEHGPSRRHLVAALRAAHSQDSVGVLLEDAEILERLLPPFIAQPGAGNAALAAFSRKLISRLRRLPATGPRSQAAAGISRQEHRVLMHLSDGCANKEIARLLDVSESAVKFHLRNLFRKLQVQRRAALLEQARARGLLS
jgi:ATP/maltotriose-dependent transcriptional regulator MalT